MTSFAPARRRASLWTVTDHCAFCWTSWPRRITSLTPGFTPLPKRSTALGTEFVEFAVDDASAPKLEKLFASLGFRRAGQHKSKAVTRWHQGAINLVVNTDKEGFAHSFNITHGSAVCALGLKVNDAAATFERAKRLFDTAVSPTREVWRT